MSEPSETLGEILQAAVEEVQENKARHEKNWGTDDESMCNWYLSELRKDMAMMETIKEQAQRRLRQIQGRMASLEYKFGADFVQAASRLIDRQPGNKSSIDLDCGRVGYRKRKETVEIIDERELADWCIENMAECISISVSRKTPIYDHIKATGNVPPGARVHPEYRVFYPTPPTGLQEFAAACEEVFGKPGQDSGSAGKGAG
jgi:hypothetical protein